MTAFVFPDELRRRQAAREQAAEQQRRNWAHVPGGMPKDMPEFEVLHLPLSVSAELRQIAHAAKAPYSSQDLKTESLPERNSRNGQD